MALENIKQNFDTKKERKGLLEEHGWWAAFLILMNIICFVFWNEELNHMYGFFKIATWLMIPVTVGGIAFIVIKDNPNNDIYKWWIGGLVIFLFAFSVGFRADYRTTDLKSRWDYKASL